MESVKEKSAEVRGFKGSLTARNGLGAIKPAEEVPEVLKGAFDVLEGKTGARKAEPKAKKPKAEKREPKIAKAKISVAISPADLELLRKAAKKAGKSVSLFAAECLAERVR